MPDNKTKEVPMHNYKYIPCNESDIPPNVRFDVPPRNQGQAVEVAYGDIGRGGPNDVGDPWKRVTDRSLGGGSDYFRRVLRGIPASRAEEILAEEGMDETSVGPVACLVVTDDGRLADDHASEPADLSSEAAFRAQVVAWRTTTNED